MPVNPLRVRTDWAKDGTFGTAGVDNVTDLVRGPINVSMGRDQSTATAPVAAGRGSFDLDNSDRRFSPTTAVVGLAGNIKPARPVLVERTVAGVTYTIVRGRSDDTPLNPDLENPRVTVSFVDTLADFRGQTLATELYDGLRTGEAIDLVLDEVGWTGGRDLDVGSSVLPWWWEDGTDALDALQKLVASEGPPALLTIGTDGSIIFRDRQHRQTLAASTTSQATWRGTEGAAEPVMGRGFTRNEAWANVVNDVRINVPERRPDGTRTEVWSTEEITSLSASQSRVFVLQASDPFRDALAPQDVFDYEVLSGSVSSVTLSRTSGQSTSITVTAGGSGARIQGMRLRALSVPVARTWGVTVTDATSITDYGRRGLPGGAEPVWASREDARAIATLYVLQRKQPLPILSVRFVCGDSQTARLSALLPRDLSDRVTVIEPESGTSGAFFIESISHNITDVTQHEIVFGLEAAPTAPSNPFILNTSTLNGAATLGY